MEDVGSSASQVKDEPPSPPPEGQEHPDQSDVVVDVEEDGGGDGTHVDEEEPLTAHTTRLVEDVHIYNVPDLELNVRSTVPLRKALVDALVDKFPERAATLKENRASLALRDKHGFLLDMRKSLVDNGVSNGATLHICMGGGAADGYKHGMMGVLIGYLALVIVLFIFVGFLPGAPFNPIDPAGNVTTLNYGLVIDAGSVHTTVNLYSWPAVRSNGTGVVKEAFSCENDAAQGISSFADDPEAVARYLLQSSDCLTQAVGLVPEALRSTTPIFLGGTAGMRVLNATNPAAAEEILEQSSTALSDLGLMKSDHTTAILDAEEEGALGWVTANYLSKKLDGGDGSTIGALDWGGASTEISFEVPDPALATKNVSVFGADYHVYSSSHLCYGQSEAARRYFVHLVYDAYKKSGKLPESVKAPCQPKGDDGSEYKLQAKDLFFSICTEYKDEAFQRLATENPERVFAFSGQSDDKKCQEEVARTFNVAECRSTYKRPHCFDPAKERAPPADSQFVAFSTYWYLVSALRLQQSEDGGLLSAQRFGDSVTSLCVSDAASANRLLGSLGPEVERTSCFKGLFMRHLLAEGYHLGQKWGDRVRFVNRIGDAEVGWTLGRMLIDTNSLPVVVVAIPPFSPKDIQDLWKVGVVFFIMFAIGLVCWICIWYEDRNEREAMERYRRIQTVGLDPEWRS